MQIECVDDETKWAALELMLGISSSVVALAKKMAKPETKTVTRTVGVPINVRYGGCHFGKTGQDVAASGLA